jgi:sterol desaturase/sphingolipid hydroxylase (fatty acid hydroxylase superfamily)
VDLKYISMIIISASAVVFVILERVYPYSKNQKIFREGFFNDFFWYTIFQSYILGVIIFAFLEFVYSNSNPGSIRVLKEVPVVYQVIIFVITHDFYIYWFHRWQHNNKYLWRIHEAHHSTKDVDWLSGSRSHSLEILINQTVEFAPIILLGAAPEVAIYKGMISAIWGMFIHSNIDVRMGMLQYFLNGPEMHRWHHSDDAGKEYQNNYSTKLAIWDWLFGSAFFPDPVERKPLRYGLSDTPDFPKKYFRQHMFAFRKFSGSNSN